MSLICPTVLASDAAEYQNQIERVRDFAERIQIDLMDGDFAPTTSLPLDQVWLPDGILADIHLMYKNPQEHLGTLVGLKPNMVIVHAESDCDIPAFASKLRDNGIKTGVAVLKKTAISEIEYILPHVQHVLIFSGDLGHFGGTADLSLLQKADDARMHNRYLELGWDGGANLENCAVLAQAGIDVINVGGAIQKADNPETTYATMKAKVTSASYV